MLRGNGLIISVTRRRGGEPSWRRAEIMRRPIAACGIESPSIMPLFFARRQREIIGYEKTREQK